LATLADPAMVQVWESMLPWLRDGIREAERWASPRSWMRAGSPTPEELLEPSKVTTLKASSPKHEGIPSLALQVAMEIGQKRPRQHHTHLERAKLSGAAAETEEEAWRCGCGYGCDCGCGCLVCCRQDWSFVPWLRQPRRAVTEPAAPASVAGRLGLKAATVAPAAATAATVAERPDPKAILPFSLSSDHHQCAAEIAACDPVAERLGAPFPVLLLLDAVPPGRARAQHQRWQVRAGVFLLALQTSALHPTGLPWCTLALPPTAEASLASPTRASSTPSSPPPSRPSLSPQ